MAVRAKEVAFPSFLDQAVPSTWDTVHGDREALAARISVMEDQGRDVTGVATAYASSAEQLDEPRFGSASPLHDRARAAI